MTTAWDAHPPIQPGGWPASGTARPLRVRHRHLDEVHHPRVCLARPGPALAITSTYIEVLHTAAAAVADTTIGAAFVIPHVQGSPESRHTPHDQHATGNTTLDATLGADHHDPDAPMSHAGHGQRAHG
jgi:hypothetical protein